RPHVVHHLNPSPCLDLEKEQVIVGHPGPALVALLAKHTLGRAIDLADNNRAIQGSEPRFIARVDARHTAQRGDLRFPKVFWVDMVYTAQIAAEQRGGWRNAADQRDVFVFTLSVGQLK